MDTSLHVAICDSNPGDRRQTERLISRESDRRINTTGVFYPDTFGSLGSIEASPMAYDVYVLDSTVEGETSVDIAHMLREKNILSPIIFCVGTLDYRELASDIDNVYFIDKPLKPSELTAIFNSIISHKAGNYVSKIELRSHYDTIYAEEDEITYLVSRGSSKMDAYMHYGEILQIDAFIDTMMHDLSIFPAFLRINKTTIVNMRYAKSIKGRSLTMFDGKVFRFGVSMATTVKEKLGVYDGGIS